MNDKLPKKVNPGVDIHEEQNTSGETACHTEENAGPKVHVYRLTAGFLLEGQTKGACHVPFNRVKCSEI